MLKMERPCKIYFPTEAGTEIWDAISDEITESIVRLGNAYPKRIIEPYNIQFISCEGKHSDYLQEWIDLGFDSISSRMGWASGYKKDIILSFNDIEYRLIGCFVTGYEFKNENLLTRQIIFEKENYFTKIKPFGLTLSIDQYSIGYHNVIIE